MLRRLLGERTGLMAGKEGGGHNYTQLGEIQFQRYAIAFQVTFLYVLGLGLRWFVRMIQF